MVEAVVDLRGQPPEQRRERIRGTKRHLARGADERARRFADLRPVVAEANDPITSTVSASI